mmetsp:Transcript_8600/g.29437  ORF Transcript_8600/g.29437 Transcript_8600/m.29437 type:complete len:226 (-) Transcript_8600:768-1445(-)
MSTSGTDQRSNFLNARECCLHLAQYHCSVSPSCSRSASFRKQSSTSMDAAPRPPSSSRRRADAWSSTASRSAASTRPARSSSDHSKVTVCTVDGSASASAPRSLSKRVPDAVDAQHRYASPSPDATKRAQCAATLARRSPHVASSFTATRSGRPNSSYCFAGPAPAAPGARNADPEPRAAATLPKSTSTVRPLGLPLAPRRSSSKATNSSLGLMCSTENASANVR